MTNAMMNRFPMSTPNVFSWHFVFLKLLLLVVLGVALEKPCGSIEGKLALQQEGFNLYTYDLKGHHVYAIAIGPRGDSSQERGVWVNQDGSFRIDQLPVGEYELKVHVPGFATSYDSGIFVDANQVTTLNNDITLELSNPSVNIASNARVFTTKEHPHFWINANGSSEATVKVYKREMLPLLEKLYGGKEKNKSPQQAYGFEITSELNIYKPYDSSSQKTASEFFDAMKPVRVWKRELKTDESDYAHEEFKFEQPLPAGDYFAVVEAKNIQKKRDWNVLWFTVTDIGLIVKQDAYQTLARAIDLNTLQPVANYELKLLNRDFPRDVITTAKTGADGFATMKAPGTITSSQNLMVYGKRGDQHSYGAYGFYNGTNDSTSTYFYTDRPVYRLGQTVYFKGIARKKTLNGFTNPGGMAVNIDVEDPDNNVFQSAKVRTNSHGSFHGLVEIPKEGKTGAYQVTVKYPDGSQDYERFEVAEYRKPEYQVDVIPLEPRVVSGNKAKARIKASYYFGAPVTNAKVKYTVYSSIDWSGRYNLMDRPAYYDYFDGWDHDDESYYDSGYSGDYISEGYATTDENGEAVVEFDTRRSDWDPERPWEYDRYDRRYKVEAEVTDISRLSVIGSGALSVTSGSFGMFCDADSYIAKVGEPIGAHVTAISYDNHQPVSNANVKVKLYRRLYDRAKSEYRGIQVYEERDVRTDAQGKAHVQFQTKPEFVTDDYEILATAEDQFHNRIVDESSVWVVSQNSPFSLSSEQAAKETLSVKLDKTVYRAGDVAKVMITAPVTGNEGAQAIVSVEGAKLYNYRVVNMTSTGQLVELPLTVDYAPNVYVNVTFVGKKHQFYTQSEMIRVSPEERFLQLAVETDKSKYKPGENATYTIHAKYADGKPAADTELSLAVVDESIFAIRPDSTPDIRKFFYARTSNMVQTICSFPEEYSGGPNKIEPRVRKDFRDTAAWLPDLVTDKDGVAKATIKLPDNLTTWRATVRGISMKTDVGSTVQKVISTQDLILRLALPRFFSQGDEGYITAVVHNYTDKPQAINLTLSPSSQFKVTDSLIQKIMVYPDKAQRFNWKMTVVGAGDAIVGCKAVGDTAGDAMQSKIPVLPLGIETFMTKSGVSTADDDTINLSTAGITDAVPGSIKHHIYLSSSALGPMLGNFHNLIDYPYGCTEQTMSRLMPAVVAIRLNQTLGLPLTADDKKKFKEVYKQAMDKLNGYQHDDGGWGWWADDQSNMNLTALVIDGYTLLKDAGYAVDPEREKNGRDWLVKNTIELQKQLSDPKHKRDTYTDTESLIDLAKGHAVLSKFGVKVPAATRAWVLANKNSTTPEALALFALAFDRTNDHETARALYDRMIELGNVVTSDAGTMLDWSPTKALMHKLYPDWKNAPSYYSYRYTDVETTALCLEAILKVDPDNSERIEQVKQWILLQRGNSGWSNTKTTSQVLRALMTSELQQRAGNGGTNFVADVNVADRLNKEFNFDTKSTLAPEKDVVLELKPGQTNVSIHKKGSGRLYYTSMTTYYRALKPNEFVAEKSMPDGLKLRREFFKMVASAPDSNGNVHFKAQPLPNNTVKAGETVLMKVYVESPTMVPYTFLKAPLPSGAEVVENNSKGDEAANSEEDANGKDKQEDGYTWGNWWWTHQDVMDDHLAFFVTDFAAGKCEFHQMVRMEIPGKFQMNPVTIEGMYTNKVRAYSQANVITVTE